MAQSSSLVGKDGQRRARRTVPIASLVRNQLANREAVSTTKNNKQSPTTINKQLCNDDKQQPLTRS